LAVALGARKLSFSLLYIPFDADFPEIKMVGIEIFYVSSLHEVLQHLSGQTLLPLIFPVVSNKSECASDKDFCDIIGHQLAERALEIVVAGEHHVFMTGLPSCGKSLLAKTFPRYCLYYRMNPS